MTKKQKINQDFENDQLKFKYGIKNRYEALFAGMVGKTKHYDKELITKLYCETGDVKSADKELAGRILDLFFTGKYNSETIVATCKLTTLTVIAEALEHQLESDVEEIKEKWT